MMFMATLTAVQAAIARIGPMTDLYDKTVVLTVFGPYFGAVLVGGVLFAARCFLTGSVDRWFACGYGGFVVYCVLILRVCVTDSWEAVAQALLRVIP